MEGSERLAHLQGPHLFVANHLSHLDAAVLLAVLQGALRRRTAVFVLAETLERARGIMRLLRSVGYVLLCLVALPIPLPQTRGFRHALARAGTHVDDGGSLIVFPEGARGRGGPLQPFATGIALAVEELQITIVPIHLRGMYALMPPGKFVQFGFRRRPVRVRVGTPFVPPRGALPEATAAIQRAVAVLA